MAGPLWMHSRRVTIWLQALWLSSCHYHKQGAWAKTEDLPPLVIIPPFTGSVLYSEIDESSVANPLCGLQVSNKVWPPATSQLLLGGLLDCWRQQMKVGIDLDATKHARKEVEQPIPGVHIHPAVGVESTGQDSLEPGVWEPVLWHLQQLGFSFGKNMFVAPFDWRRGPSYWNEKSWPRLKSKVESWVAASTGKKPAIFISMSLGCPYFTAFLQNHRGITPHWRKQHVAGFVSLSGVYSGTVSALSLLLWGRLWPGPDEKGRKNMYDRQLTQEAQEVLSPLLHGWGSIAWLLPTPSPVRPKQQSIIDLPPAFRGNATVSQLPSLLASTAPTSEALLLAGARFSASAHPGVKVHCFFGTGKETPVRVSYRKGGIHKEEANAKMRAAVAARLAAEKLKKRGINLGDDKTQASAVGLVSEVAELLAPSTTAATSLATPKEIQPPPRSTRVGSDAWLRSTSELLKEWMPSETISGPGDGLVEHDSLAMCERWKGESGLPDAEVTSLPGSGHAEESHNAEALLKIRAAVASLAGVNISRTRAGQQELCKTMISKCPQVRNSDECAKLAVQRQLSPTHRCCQEGAAMSECVPSHCFAEMLGGFIAADPHVAGVVKAWHQSCPNVRFPSWPSILYYAKQRSQEPWTPKAAPENACLAKLPGQGCPAMPMLQQCAGEASAGLLRPQHPCCTSLVRSLDCMGTRCFTDFVSVGLTAAETLGGQPARGILLALRSGCREVRLPVEAILVSANRTHAAVDRLLPAGIAAASQVWQGLMDGAKADGGADAEDEGGENNIEESADKGGDSPEIVVDGGDRETPVPPQAESGGGGFIIFIGVAVVLLLVAASGVSFAVLRHRSRGGAAARDVLLKEMDGGLALQADVSAPVLRASNGAEAYLAMQDP